MCGRELNPLLDALHGWLTNDNTLVVLDTRPESFMLTAQGILPIDLLGPALTTPTAQAIDTTAVALTLGIPQEHVKVRVHRLRTALRESVLRVVAETMPAATRSEVEEEMRDLMAALG